jgi:antitoxin VapB
MSQNINHLNDVRHSFRHAEPLNATRAAPAIVRHAYPAKIFKSGNSLALRLPAALGLEAGMEMVVTDLQNGGYMVTPLNAPKRKIDVSKFAGKAPWLKELTAEDREFEHRELDWHLLSKPEEQP